MEAKVHLEAAAEACAEALALLDQGKNFEAKQKAREAKEHAQQAEFRL